MAKQTLKEDKKRWEKVSCFVSLRDLFESCFCFFFVGGVLVRVPFHGQLSVRFLQIILRSISVNLQHIVVIQTHVLFFFFQQKLEYCNCYNKNPDSKIQNLQTYTLFMDTRLRISTLLPSKFKTSLEGQLNMWADMKREQALLNQIKWQQFRNNPENCNWCCRIVAFNGLLLLNRKKFECNATVGSARIFFSFLFNRPKTRWN